MADDTWIKVIEALINIGGDVWKFSCFIYIYIYIINPTDYLDFRNFNCSEDIVGITLFLCVFYEHLFCDVMRVKWACLQRHGVSSVCRCTRGSYSQCVVYYSWVMSCGIFLLLIGLHPIFYIYFLFVLVLLGLHRLRQNYKFILVLVFFFLLCFGKAKKKCCVDNVLRICEVAMFQNKLLNRQLDLLRDIVSKWFIEMSHLTLWSWSLIGTFSDVGVHLTLFLPFTFLFDLSWFASHFYFDIIVNGYRHIIFCNIFYEPNCRLTFISLFLWPSLPLFFEQEIGIVIDVPEVNTIHDMRTR